MPVTGWKLDRNVRAQLLERFPPTWPDVIADHVTLQAGASANEPLPAQEAAEIVGKVDDGEGLQALIVSIDGSTDRPDGSRSEERRVGKEWGSTCRFRWAQEH